MTTPAQAVEDQLVALEEQAAADSDAAIEAAIVASGLTAAALAAAIPTLTSIISRAADQAVRLGAAMAAAAAAGGRGGPGRTVRRGRRGARRVGAVRFPRRAVPRVNVARGVRAVRSAGRAVARVDVARRVRDVMSAAAVALRRTESPEQARVEVDRAKAQIRSVAATAVNEGASAGAQHAAPRLGASGLMWVAERDACLHCLALSGHVIKPGERFPASVTWGDRPLKWREFSGRPPRHPHCRCRIRPVIGDASALSDVLQREARRSVVRGFSLPTESQPARLRAAARMLRRGAGLPKSVEAYGRQAVREGRFPRGRDVPTGARRRTR